MLLNNSNTFYFLGSFRLFFEKRYIRCGKMVIYFGNFIWSYFAVLLVDGISDIRFFRRQKEQVLVVGLGGWWLRIKVVLIKRVQVFWVGRIVFFLGDIVLVLDLVRIGFEFWFCWFLVVQFKIGYFVLLIFSFFNGLMGRTLFFGRVVVRSKWDNICEVVGS